MQQAITADPPLHVTYAISDFATAATADSIPESARAVMRLSLVDWAVVAVAGCQEPVSRTVRAVAAQEGGVPEADVIGLDIRLPARAAALANATAAHALDYDDTHFMHIGHASAVVVAAALAAAQKTAANGGAFLDACLIGVETATRIGGWLGRAHYLKGFHSTATAGSFGAAAAVSRLLGLSSEQMAHALGLTTTRASGLKSQFGTMGKPYNAGIAASNGVETATLAAAGMISCTDGLETAQGFAATHEGERDDRVFDGLGERFVFDSVQHKFHACCHGTHAALEALIAVRDANRLTPDQIAEVRITVNPCWLGVCNIAEPTTGLEAKFSYRMTAALALLGYDTAALATFNEAVCRDPQIVALRDRVVVATDGGVSETAARIRVRRRDEPPIDADYDLAREMPLGQRQTRVHRKAVSLLGEQRADALWRFVHDGDGLLSDWFAANRDLTAASDQSKDAR